MICAAMTDTARRNKKGYTSYDYDPERIADRIDKAREAAGLNVKSFAESIWPALGERARFTYYKKRAGETSSWELDEIERVCVVLRAPLGWPFIGWAYAQRLADED